MHHSYATVSICTATSNVKPKILKFIIFEIPNLYSRHILPSCGSSAVYGFIFSLSLKNEKIMSLFHKDFDESRSWKFQQTEKL